MKKPFRAFPERLLCLVRYPDWIASALIGPILP
jgi:hypothetical protein